MHWPKGIAARGERRRNPGHAIDLVPTILEAAGGERFVKWEGKPVPAPPGKSIVPVFTRDGSVSRDDFWWYHEGNRAIRVGDWKLVAAGATGPWELYDLSTDRAESKNLVAKRPDKARQLEQAWTRRLNEFRELVQRDLPRKKTGNDRR